ncbi:hypothetical protein, variant 3 [Aphanomyces astaci]|uniref:Poly A polymerase head domain-containing protein n=1 Tax=Aphanomyces astaci TaxID=112090 RepID=W4GA91_APHAT|nr:hypothetical protein, variant 2 [Aphanomyces astaci]XP_009834138.1 hypothetical protein, variant 3 [Aphanomyces astaci]ETV76592.1 hypothetical protein, variant 2 [Aphanomyces astaci]ETV76593.1 hypothetical protein, variant 3 [Aphanomyces astaci]|eukprot:XP_009834136.1 hypothetical protein, variant 2 [Aphanomyces astaci]
MQSKQTFREVAAYNWSMKRKLSNMDLLPVMIALTADEEKLFDFLLDVEKQNNCGLTLRVAGGWVRDKLLGRASDDIDIVLDNMTGVAFAELVNAYETQHGHKTHAVGVIKANPDQSKHLETATMQLGSGWVDFVNLRAETYADDEAHRIPSMEFGTPLEDAQRRDFTINSLFYNLATKSVEDFTGQGLPDLQHGVIRTPLDPTITFLDDPLRVLRAIRFASRFRFPLADDLIAALEHRAIREALVKKVSRERVGKELGGMLTGSHANPMVALTSLHRFHLDEVVFQLPTGPFFTLHPPLEAAIPPHWTDTSMACVQALHALDLARQDQRAPSSPTTTSSSTSSTTADGIEVTNNEATSHRLKLRWLAAVLLPLAEYSIVLKKKHVPVAHAIVRESIKFAAKDADVVSLVLLNQCRRFVAANAPFDRVQVGLVLRDVGALWPLAVDMAYLVEVVLQHSDVEQTREKYAALSAYVVNVGLDRVWEMKPLLNVR